EAAAAEPIGEVGEVPAQEALSEALVVEEATDRLDEGGGREPGAIDVLVRHDSGVPREFRRPPKPAHCVCSANSVFEAGTNVKVRLEATVRERSPSVAEGRRSGRRPARGSSTRFDHHRHFPAASPTRDLMANPAGSPRVLDARCPL